MQNKTVKESFSTEEIEVKSTMVEMPAVLTSADLERQSMTLGKRSIENTKLQATMDLLQSTEGSAKRLAKLTLFQPKEKVVHLKNVENSNITTKVKVPKPKRKARDLDQIEDIAPKFDFNRPKNEMVDNDSIDPQLSKIL